VKGLPSLRNHSTIRLIREGGLFISTIYGNVTGLKSAQIKRIEHIYRRRIPADKVITPELGRYLAEISREIKRQIGILVGRQGHIEYVLVGSEREIVIPDLSKYRLGKKRLRGVRCIHTHLKNEPLSQDDLTDLALLRLDLIAAIGVLENGLPGDIYISYLVPFAPGGKLYEIMPPVSLHELDLNMRSFVEALEDEIVKAEGFREGGGRRERAILVSVSTDSKEMQEDSIEELHELARTSNLAVVDVVLQRPKKTHPKYLMGEGKVRELIIKALQRGAGLIVFDQNLTPAQIKAISAITELKIIDRTQLILDIFARRAHSRDGKVQVELAQLKYLLPRLDERSTALSRLTGGIGGRGPGETKLEIHRRRVRDKISRLEKELSSLSKGREQRRSKRAQSNLPIISIVGYTNAGKSTLLNALTDSSVQTEDLLFATLDTSSKRLRFPREREVIITDTVGFIRDLPQDLLTAFKATLEELRDADLLIHVVDASNSQFDRHIKTVNSILEDLDLGHIPVLLVFNKEDKVKGEIIRNLCNRYNAISISALDRTTLHKLLKAMERKIWADFRSEGAEKETAFKKVLGT
jgi:GTP-binding protein HflX